MRIMVRRDFTTQEILKRLKDLEPVCKICGANAFKKELNLHHKDGDSSNNKWDNIVIYCRACHNDIENIKPKNRKI